MNIKADVSVASKSRTDHLVHAGQRVIAQTLSAILTERLLPDDCILAAPDKNSTGLVRILSHQDDVIYEAEARRTLAYDRWIVNGESVWRNTAGERTRCDDPMVLLNDLLPLLPGEEETRSRFRKEIQHTFLNHSASLQPQDFSRTPLSLARYDEAEARLTDGHRYHPCFKSRIGFTPSENRRFGPEFVKPLKPVWLAVHNDLARSSSIEVPDAQDALLLRRADAPEVGTDYHVVPVHPWQWERELEFATTVPRAQGRIIYLGEASHDYLAQQSIRTLADNTTPTGPSLKLALSIRNTSTARTLAAHTVLNAPIISAWLAGIAAGDPWLEEAGTVFLLERMGTTVKLPRDCDPDGALAGAFASIWRDPVHGYLKADEKASPFSMLTHMEETGRPAIEPWIGAYGAETWVRSLLTAAAIPVVHLLAAHGVAVESHQQNMVLIHRNGLPTRVALKDFHDGVRFIPSALAGNPPVLVATPSEHARVNPNSYVEAQDPHDVRDFMFDAVFGVNLAELAYFLELHFGFSEKRFWTITADLLSAHLETNSQWKNRADYFGLWDTHVVVEALARRRLQNGPVDNINVPNPLLLRGDA